MFERTKKKGNIWSLNISMVKKRQIRSNHKNRVFHKTAVQKENSIRFNALLMSAIAVFVILFIYFLFFQSYFNLNSIKITTHSITGKVIQSTDVVLNLTFNDVLPAGSGVVSGATLTTDGKSGKAYSFDGVDDYINLTGFTQPTEQITISAWIYPKYHYGRSIILFSGYNSAGKQGINFAVNNQRRLSFIIGNGTYLSNNVSNTVLSLNAWHHVVAVKNNTHIYLFVDNIKQAQTFQLAGKINYSSMLTRIGNPNNSTFNGTIDEVKVFNRALIDAEVVAEYNSYAPPITPPNFSCEDSDINAFGGQNSLTKYYIRGFINTSIDGINYAISEDSCTANNSSVIEYYCNNSNLGQSRNYTCPTSCKNGACIGISKCTDTDVMNYSIQGSINYSIDGIDLIYNDYCSPETDRTLVEFFCSGNNSNYSFYSCPANYSCFAGRCNNTAVSDDDADINGTLPAPVCTDEESKCVGTSYILCENGQWLQGVLISGECGYDEGTGTDTEIIDEPVTDTISPQKKSSSGIWIVLLIFLIVAVVAVIAVIFFIFLKKRNEFNDKTKTMVRPSTPSSPSPYSKTPSVQLPIPSSILPPPSTPPKTTATAPAASAASSISSASNLKKRQL